MTSCNKKKLNIGNNKVKDNTKICKFVTTISDRLSVGTNPPEDMVVNARLTASSNLMSTKLYKKTTKIVEEK